MNSILFVTDKYTAGNPAYGLSNHFHHLFHTFSYCQPKILTHFLHFDESSIYGNHIDNLLLLYCQKFGINDIVICLLGNSPINPSHSCLFDLKLNGIRLYFVWCDNNPTEIALQDSVRGIADLNIILDYPRSAFHDARIRTEQDLYLWTPESKFLYYPEEQTAEISFIGSQRYPDRKAYIDRLKEKIPDLVTKGGQREGPLSPDGYAQLIRKSKININFCQNMDGYTQCKGRVFEALASKTLLLEEKGESTPNFFTPGEHYVEFENFDDLVEKIEYYRHNYQDRLTIAEQGYQHFMKNWRAEHFWQKIMEKINEAK